MWARPIFAVWLCWGSLMFHHFWRSSLLCKNTWIWRLAALGERHVQMHTITCLNNSIVANPIRIMLFFMLRVNRFNRRISEFGFLDQPHPDNIGRGIETLLLPLSWLLAWSQLRSIYESLHDAVGIIDRLWWYFLLCILINYIVHVLFESLLYEGLLDDLFNLSES
jgi:hypothetical protein